MLGSGSMQKEWKRRQETVYLIWIHRVVGILWRGSNTLVFYCLCKCCACESQHFGSLWIHSVAVNLNEWSQRTHEISSSMRRCALLCCLCCCYPLLRRVNKLWHFCVCRLLLLLIGSIQSHTCTTDTANEREVCKSIFCFNFIGIIVCKLCKKKSK